MCSKCLFKIGIYISYSLDQASHNKYKFLSSVLPEDETEQSVQDPVTASGNCHKNFEKYTHQPF